MEHTWIDSREKSIAHCQLCDLHEQINLSQCVGNIGTAALWCSTLGL